MTFIYKPTHIIYVIVRFLAGDDSMPVLHIHRQSGYLLGRDRKVADIPIDHPSCSKQHAVLQFRSVDYTVSVTETFALE